jgi:hypothetical protein
VLGGGASFEKGGMTTDQALGANRWFVDLAVKDNVVPASAAPDSADGARAMALLEQTIAGING